MTVVVLNLILGKGVRRSEELKTPRYASAAATRNYITTCNIIPNTGNSSFVVAIYIQIPLDWRNGYQSSSLTIAIVI